MPTIGQGFQLLKNMGWRYMRFRIAHELEKRSGLFKKRFPQNPKPKQFIELKEWKKTFRFWGVAQEDEQNSTPSAIPDFNLYLEGKIPFFSAEIKNLGQNYDWLTNPDSGHRYDPKKHWSQIEDYSLEKGDIKYVWEKSRFSYLYDVIRNDFYTGKDRSEWVFGEINSWMDANPINSGPNYKCSQEISLRVLNWTYVLNYYRDSEHLTEGLFQKIMHAVYWQLKHVYANIDFSRIAVRNNHAITETLTLYLAGLFFPFFPEAETWKKKGKQWFEQEIEYQVYPDGTFLQFSMNYHRVVVQLFTWALRSAEFFGEDFGNVVYERAYKSLVFLRTCQDEHTGWLPNYGSNDGALFFKFNSCDFRDYRPQLNALHLLLSGEKLYDNGDWDEDTFWFTAEKIKKTVHEASPGEMQRTATHKTNPVAPVARNARFCGDRKSNFSAIQVKKGWNNFEIGGYYVLREPETITFIRCGKHKDRPAQADNLHVDIWHNGKNILFDGGSYKYNTDAKTIKYFAGTESHNTVMLNGHDQMLKGSRFIWYNWSQAISVKTAETENEYTFSGEISAFSYLDPKTRHKRSIRKKKGFPKWEVEDTILFKPKNIAMKQYWHPLPFVKIKSKDKSNNLLGATKEEGFKSDYYGKKEKALQRKIETGFDFIGTSIELG